MARGMAVPSSSRTTGLVSRKALLYLLSAGICLVQQRQKMQDCVPLDVLSTCQAHRPHTVTSRDKDFTPECCCQVSFGSLVEPPPIHPAQALCPTPGMSPGCKHTVVIPDFYGRLDFIQSKCAKPDLGL